MLYTSIYGPRVMSEVAWQTTLQKLLHAALCYRTLTTQMRCTVVHHPPITLNFSVCKIHCPMLFPDIARMAILHRRLFHSTGVRITPALVPLHWWPIGQHVTFKTATLAFKVLLMSLHICSNLSVIMCLSVIYVLLVKDSFVHIELERF
jgi:hypothetical protein